jgi:hypothetical protein
MTTRKLDKKARDMKNRELRQKVEKNIFYVNPTPHYPVQRAENCLGEYYEGMHSWSLERIWDSDLPDEISDAMVESSNALYLAILSKCINCEFCANLRKRLFREVNWISWRSCPNHEMPENWYPDDMDGLCKCEEAVRGKKKKLVPWSDWLEEEDPNIKKKDRRVYKIAIE